LERRKAWDYLFWQKVLKNRNGLGKEEVEGGLLKKSLIGPLFIKRGKSKRVRELIEKMKTREYVMRYIIFLSIVFHSYQAIFFKSI